MSLDYNLYALDASSGAKLWNFSIEGYAYASPMVANGVVYFDGIPGSVFGVNAKTAVCCGNSSPAALDV